MIKTPNLVYNLYRLTALSLNDGELRSSSNPIPQDYVLRSYKPVCFELTIARGFCSISVIYVVTVAKDVTFQGGDNESHTYRALVRDALTRPCGETTRSVSQEPSKSVCLVPRRPPAVFTLNCRYCTVQNLVERLQHPLRPSGNILS